MDKPRQFIGIQVSVTSQNNGQPVLFALDSLGCVWMNMRPQEWNSWVMIFPGFPYAPEVEADASSDLLADELHLKQKKILGV